MFKWNIIHFVHNGTPFTKRLCAIAYISGFQIGLRGALVRYKTLAGIPRKFAKTVAFANLFRINKCSLFPNKTALNHNKQIF